MIPQRRSSRLGAVLRDLIEAVVLAAVLFLVLQFTLQNTIVEGASMEPNLVDRQWLLVNKVAYRLGEPERGDVIVFHAPDQPGKDFIKAGDQDGLATTQGQLRLSVTIITTSPSNDWHPSNSSTAGT